MTNQTPDIPARPFCLEYADAKSEVFSAVNAAIQKHSIPLFLMESILSEVYQQVKDGAKAEMQNAKTVYQKQLDEFNKAEEREGE